MDARRAFAINMLEQLIGALREMSDEDFDRLLQGQLEASIAFVEAPRRTQDRRKRGAHLADEVMKSAHSELKAAGSREEGQRIVEEAFADKERLFAFAKYLDLPVQRNDSVKRIRDKVVTHTVGRRLGGMAVRGGAGGNARGKGS